MTSSYMEPDPMKKSPPDYPGPPSQHGPNPPGFIVGPTAIPNQPGPSSYPPPGVYQQSQPAYPPPPQPQGAWGESPPGYPPSGYPPPSGPPMGYGYGPPPPQQQQQQQVVVIGSAGPAAAVPVVHVETFVGQIVLSCFVFWCCNWLFGLIAFILAMMAGSYAVNDKKGARKMGKASYGVSIAGIIITVVIIAIVVGVVVTRTAQVVNAAVGTYSSYSNSYSSCSYYYYNSACYKTYSSLYTKSYCTTYLNGYYSGSTCYYNY